MSAESTPRIVLTPLVGEYVIARLSPGDSVPGDLLSLADPHTYVSVTRTSQELSIVCTRENAPEGAELDGPWRAWYAAGPIPFGLTGVVAALVDPLAEIGCPVFVTSTFDGDVLMVPEDRAEDAKTALTAAGHDA